MGEASVGRARRMPRIAVMAAAALAVVSVLECSPSRSVKRAPTITAERTPSPLHYGPAPDTDAKWSWPGASHFRATVAAVHRDASAVRLVQGSLEVAGDDGVTDVEDVLLAVSLADEGFTLGVELAPDGQARPLRGPSHGFRLVAGSIEAQPPEPLTFVRAAISVRVLPAHVSPDRPTREALDDFAYAAALLGADPPVYDDAAGSPEEKGEAIERAVAAGDEAGALALYRTWRPVGRCSMDSRPAAVAREYAELCYRVGKLGCFLQLQVRIMGDQFDRVAYSSYGEAAHATEAARLAETGIDVERFLLGLALRFDNVNRLGALGGHRLVRSIRESGREDSIVATLSRWAVDPRFDEYNALRAVQLLAALERLEDVDGDELPDSSQRWLERQR